MAAAISSAAKNNALSNPKAKEHSRTVFPSKSPNRQANSIAPKQRAENTPSKEPNISDSSTNGSEQPNTTNDNI